MADLSGTTLGKYQLIERLGRGGMADVYKGYQPGLDRYIAVKVLHPHLSEDPDFITRFRREAKSVADLRHPHIVQVFDFDIQGENYYMVMEYVEGGKTLKQMLQELAAKGERLPLDRTLDVVASLADALAYAHGLGMIHRDIKPANVLLPSLERPVLSDFGIARLIGETGLTGSGVMIGTPAYMSPEQGRGERGEARSDIYALGIVLYEMLTGRPPYDADTPYAVILKHINDPLVPPRAVIGALPEAVERIVLRCLAKNPEDRFASMGDLRNALRSAKTAIEGRPGPATLSVAAPPTESLRVQPPVPEAVEPVRAPVQPAAPAIQPARRPRWIIPAAAIAIVGIAVVLVVAAIASRPPTPATPTPARAAIPPTEATSTFAETREAQVQVEVGYEHLFEGDTEAALERFNQALSIEAGYPPALVGRAIAELFNYGDMDQVAGDLGRAAPALQGDPFFHFALGLQHLRSEKQYDPNLARGDLTQAIEKCGDRVKLCVAALYERAQLHAWTLGDTDGALADMSRAIERLPQDDDLYAARADISATAGNPEAALQDLETAYELSQWGEYLERAAAVAVQAGDFGRALGYTDRLLTDQPDNPHYVVNRGYVEWRAGNLEAAQQTAQNAIEQYNALEAHYLMGLVLLDAGDPQAALAELRSFGAETDPDIIYQASFPFFTTQFGHNVYYDMARAARASGDVDSALALIDRSLQEDDYWPWPYIERGQILAEQGDIRGARQNYAMALEIASDNPELQAAIQELIAAASIGTIKIATQSPLTGSLSALGIDLRNGAELALEQLGGDLREMGFNLQLAPFDDQASPDVGVATAQDIAADPDILCVVGPLLSTVAMPASEIYHQAGLVMVSPSATTPRVTEPGYLEINRVVGRDDVQSAVGAQYAQSIGVESVYVLHDDSAYGQGVAEFFAQRAAELGITVVDFVGTQERTNFAAVIEPVLAAEPGAVYFGGYYDQVGPFIRQLRELGYPGIFMGPDGLDSPALAELAGEALIGGGGTIYTTVSGPASFYPDAAQFIGDFRARYGAEPQPFAAQAYDATGICLSAIQQWVELTGGEAPNREQAATAVRATKDYSGITGSLSFDSHGDLTVARYFVVRVLSADPARWSENRLEYTLDYELPNE
ncbi:MAG TPA: ABC transporter substrate-binding protein [Anaerolineae bacterium]|nr:ABC transporter substrate-binding protein [Anaerolineae bacterium]